MRANRGAHGTEDSGTVDRGTDLARLVVDEITWYLRENKISRAELAQTMGVSPGRVSQILSGDENLNLRTLASVLAAVGARAEWSLHPAGEPEELLTDDTDPDSDPPGA